MILKIAGNCNNFSLHNLVKKARLRASKKLLKKIISNDVDLLNKVDTNVPLDDLGSNFDGVRSSGDSLPLGVTQDQTDF
jgi:hypothetical protein